MKHIYLCLFMLCISLSANAIHNTTPKSETSKIKLYPNPAYGNEIYITTSATGNKIVTVYDIFGGVQLKKQLTTNTLDISRLSAGTYILEVIQNNTTMTHKLVVK